MNTPTYTTKRLSFGPGVLYIGAAGATPMTDIGAVKTGATLTITRDKLEVKQGSPESLIKQWVVSETVKLDVVGLEWNLDNLQYAIGAGVISTNGDETDFGLGGDMEVTEASLKFVHQMPAGGTVEIDIWKAQSAGELSVSFGNDPHEFPYSFIALDSTTDWSGSALDSKAKLVKIALTGTWT